MHLHIAGLLRRAARGRRGIARFGAKSFDMAYQITVADGRLVALARTVQVMYAYAAARTIAVPEDFQHILTDNEKSMAC